MKKILTTLFTCLILTQAFGQTERKLSTYLSVQYNYTMYDITSGNNPWGIGLGLQTFFNNKTKFKPTVEFTADTYLADDKVARVNTDGKIIDDVRSMFNLFAGASFQPKQNVYFSIIAGPSFINGQTLFGIKPSLGFYFSNKQKWMAKVSYINIFNRDKETQEDFGTISLAVGFKLF